MAKGALRRPFLHIHYAQKRKGRLSPPLPRPYPYGLEETPRCPDKNTAPAA